MDSFGYFKYGSNENTELKSGDATGDFQSPCGYYHIERSFNLDSVQIQASRPNYTVQITTKGNATIPVTFIVTDLIRIS